MIPQNDTHQLLHDVKDFYMFLRVRKQRLKAELDYVTRKIKALEFAHKIKGENQDD